MGTEKSVTDTNFHKVAAYSFFICIPAIIEHLFRFKNPKIEKYIGLTYTRT